MFCEKKINELVLPEIWPESCVDWETRRLEIADLLQHELFGYRPADPETESFKILENESDRQAFGGKAYLLKIQANTIILGKQFSFPFYAAVPIGKKDIPFFVHINFRSAVPDKYMPTEEIIDNGFAVFSFGYQDVTSDDSDFTDRLAGLISENEKRENVCGKIPMWSWAASRVMDYCMTLDCLDMSRSSVVGHSRLGKTSLFTGMMDNRFQYVISNESGFAGAALNRSQRVREGGCSVEFCVNNHMQWFSWNYRKYVHREHEMPYDQHFLVAASAPRHVYVGSAVGDTWSDPETEYLSCVAAGEVYERLSLNGFVHPDRFPVPGDVLQEGRIAYHMRKGLHFFSREDWNLYCKYVLENDCVNPDSRTSN